MSHIENVTASHLLLVEYDHLKAEQRARIGFRDNLLYVTLASMAAIVAAVLQGPSRPGLLLLMPPVCVILGWTYVVNDEKISAIGRYVREHTAPHLEAAAAAATAPAPPAAAPPFTEAFGWERVHRSDAHRRNRKRLQLGADLLAFCGAPLAALAVYWAGEPSHPALLGTSFAETLTILLLAVQIARYADLRTGAS
ncbi:hypothetical protein [Streptomyces apocyni]|uniref:hypothetical protein n=1 Tax=Streptomyces apocyni TaxID=2654677 RepID=UPI0012EA9E62|nr:hypothetical protein [Streptomyces apocyni]